MTEMLKYEREGDIAIITLDNPARLNPLTLALQQGLRELLARVREDSAVRAMVLTASGTAFCVGADLADLVPAEPGGPGLG